MLLFGLLKRPLSKVPTAVGLIACVLLYLMTMDIGEGIVALWSASQVLYTSNWLCPFGILAPGFVSADYFPLFPGFSSSFSELLSAGLPLRADSPKFAYRSCVPFFSWLGRHALIIYVVHQPIIYGIAWLLTVLF